MLETQDDGAATADDVAATPGIADVSGSNERELNGARMKTKMKAKTRIRITGLIAAALCLSITERGWSALTFTVEANGWPSTAHRDAAVNALQSSVNRYNAYGDFGNYNVYAYYNAGIPTAQANYLGSIGYGGTYPNERVTLHEMSHYLGTGTHGTPWDGTRSEAIVDQFDGLEASLNGDSTHYWPYGLNYDSEGSEINKQRHVALLYAMRADMGIGSSAYPSAPATVSLRASDAVNESAFNYASSWSNNRFAQRGTQYNTGNYTLRTPASANSFTFVGESLTVNNTNGINGGLLYKGTGSSGTVSFKKLNVAGGYVRHAGGFSDVFRLAGSMTLTSTATIDAAQGAIALSASMDGSGSLTKTGSFPLTLTGSATYAGDTTINAGILRLAPVAAVASYTFDNVSGTTVANGGTGGSAMNGALANGAAIVANGQTGNAVSLSNGASVDINNRVVDMGYNNNWSVSAWVKTSTQGSSLLSKGDGTGWSNGNTILYLGDGSAGGSGSLPSAVRWGGGFLQGSTASTPVADGVWHQLTYVNSAGSYAIYVDGVAQPLSAVNAGFGNSDVSSKVRLGVSTNTSGGDGTLNFNGLMDNVNFYAHALSPSQVAALYGGGTAFGSLPSGTNLTIASGATLDLNGTTQQIGSLNGANGAAVTLGAGRLIVNTSAAAQFAGTISGTGGSLVKQGTGTLTLSGANSYTGGTVVQGGTLVLGAPAHAAILGETSAGADLQAGTLVFDYAGAASPASQIAATLDAGFDQATKFSAGKLRNTILLADHLLGWREDASAQTVTVLSTLAGDANLDLVVNFDDLLLLAQNYGASGKVWGEGDANYDGLVDFDDLLALAQHYGLSAGVVAQAPSNAGAFAADWNLARSMVPEPVACVLALPVALLARRRRR